jgi:hypothetical protein
LEKRPVNPRDQWLDFRFVHLPTPSPGIRVAGILFSKPDLAANNSCRFRGCHERTQNELARKTMENSSFFGDAAATAGSVLPCCFPICSIRERCWARRRSWL